MRIIDGHIHVLDRQWVPAAMRSAWARQAAGRRLPERDPAAIEPGVMVRQSDPTGKMTVAAFDRVGVELGVIPVVDWTLVGGGTPGDLPIGRLHQHHEELVHAWPGRFVFCAGLDPRHPDAPEAARADLERPGCVGFKLYPAAGWSVDDPAHAWVFELAAACSAPLVVHTSPLGGDPLVTPNSRPAALAGVMARHPEVTWVFAHAGFEAWWAEAVDIASGWRRTFLDISLWQRAADRDYAAFRRRVAAAVAGVGAHRVIFGSDIIRGPGQDPDGDDLARWVDQCSALAEPFNGTPPVLSGEQLEQVLSGSAVAAYSIGDGR